MDYYTYDGPVKVFDAIYSKRWTGTTRAVSEQSARKNLAFQCKKEFGMSVNSRLTLPGVFKKEDPNGLQIQL